MNFIKRIFFLRKTLAAIQEIAKDPGVSFLSIDAPHTTISYCNFDATNMVKYEKFIDAGMAGVETYRKRLQLISELIAKINF